MECMRDERSNWGRHEEVLYIRPIMLVLCAQLNGKKGHVAALDEDSIRYEQCAVYA